MGPWTSDEIARARRANFIRVLDFLGAYHKRDAAYTPVNTGSIRLQVNLNSRDFRFIFTGEKWLNELAPLGETGRGGGGAIDLVRHLTGAGFVQAVKICLDAEREAAR